MDKFNLAQEIVIEATHSGCTDTLKSKGHQFYKYLETNVSEIKGNGRHSFHIGNAFYFYRTVLTDKKSIEYKLSLLIAYINLYEALQYQDIQSIVAAYRLHILIASEKSFFEPKMMTFMGKTVGEILDTPPNEINASLRKSYFALQYCLFQFCQESKSPIAWECLQKSEKQNFESIYKEYQQKYKISDFNNDKYFELGNKLLNALYKVMIESDLQQFEFLGVF